MTLGDIDAQFRIYTGEPDPTGRWSYSDAANLINEGRNYISMLTHWPDATWVNVLTGPAQEFTLPEILEIDRVYLNGQPIVPTSIPALEGTDIELYDQSSQTTQFTPNWNSQPYSIYPVPNSQFGYPAGMPPSFFQGQRPGYYLRGGNIGFVPPPTTGSYNIQIDGVTVPPPLVNQSDVDIFPSFMKFYIAWRAAMVAQYGDKASESMQLAAGMVKDWEKMIISWVRNLQKNRPKAARFISYRHRYNRASTVGR